MDIKIDSIKKTLTPIGEYPLYVSEMKFKTDEKHSSLTNKECDIVFEELKNIFDLILIDFPITSHGKDVMLSSRIDGVILVVEAEKTRWQVAEKMKEQVVGHGDKVLGVVLNKRRFPIPETIYKRI